MIRSVAVVGMGLMGRPVATTLSRAGFRVTAWNRTPRPDVAVDGVARVSALSHAAEADACVLLLADSVATCEVLHALEPSLRARGLVIDMGSSDPEDSRRHAARLAARDVGWVDAPVSGGPEGAAAASLAIMAGGREDDVRRARPLLEALGRVTHIGEAGAGHLTKIVNQLIVGLVIEAVAEAIALAERAGLDPRAVQDALRGGLADSRLLHLHGSRMIERRYVPGGKVSAHLKDLRMAIALADRLGLELPHGRSVLSRYERLAELGYADDDHSALHRLLAGEG
jgi:3-hydroxyisobutyrate dehydrogenase-like beta-hydroxyacid dehydrogenase